MKKVFFLALGFWLAVCGGLCAFPLEPAAASGNTEIHRILSDLEKKMQQIETLHTHFVQKKQSSLFQREIRLQGSIAMQKPDHFAWRTESPLRYAIVAANGKISQWDEDTDRVEILSFSSSPVVRMVIEQMQAWFYGAYGALMDQYEITLVSKEPLVLKFVPNERGPVSGMIRSVTLRFQADLSYIESILIEEKNGDHASMEFTGTVLNSKMDTEVWEVKHGA